MKTRAAVRLCIAALIMIVVFSSRTLPVRAESGQVCGSNDRAIAQGVAGQIYELQLISIKTETSADVNFDVRDQYSNSYLGGSSYYISPGKSVAFRSQKWPYHPHLAGHGIHC